MTTTVNAPQKGLSEEMEDAAFLKLRVYSDTENGFDLQPVLAQWHNSVSGESKCMFSAETKCECHLIPFVDSIAIRNSYRNPNGNYQSNKGFAEIMLIAPAIEARSIALLVDQLWSAVCWSESEKVIATSGAEERHPTYEQRLNAVAERLVVVETNNEEKFCFIAEELDCESGYPALDIALSNVQFYQEYSTQITRPFYWDWGKELGVEMTY
tara:strand:+ start:114 stop:749 length:636 start_codon:yes stop_codon:yes gene_type:complete